MYVLKKASLESVDILRKLMISTYKQAYKKMHTKENIELYCNKNFTKESVKSKLFSEVYICMLAFKKDSPVGFCILKDSFCPVDINGSSLELQQLYILKNEYNNGLGKQLFTQAVKIAKEKYKEYLWLYVSDTNEKALSFYDSMGLNKVGIGKKFKVGEEIVTSSIMAYKL